MLFFAIAVSLATVSYADITGQRPASGTCLCVTGTNVNARASGSSHAAVVGTVSTPECYKLNGGIVTADGYTWYELQNVNGHKGWVAGTFLSIGTAAQCTTSSTGGSTGGSACSDATAKDYACKLLAAVNSGSMAAAKAHASGMHDNAYPYNNLQDACAGRAAARSSYQDSGCPCHAPGGHVCLSAKILKYLWDLHSHFGYIHINELSGGCHSCHSAHYAGTATDIHNPPDQRAYMVSFCKSSGAALGQDEGNHVHCNF
ncbi:uncharacterized protein LOC127847862 [Dreissena polymorpha]|uniref:SH3b domain-containing protein n=1 Tax=Dreissena polymorpha TaxID=45954 RepID=A0A9D4DC42_DREPO|nr:uncharacterized protein LOC127847862 [Dreissena polymorpha]KAH3746897.1 hypothetical protein DPMN_181315 [Dreissena polymorpha]